jgi:hypothetical protein
MLGPSDSNACVDPGTDDASRSPKFGATYIWGDSMSERPQPTHVRFYFQNCRIQATDAARVTMYKDMLSLNADVIGLAETHLNSRHIMSLMMIFDDYGTAIKLSTVPQMNTNPHEVLMEGPSKSQPGNYPVASQLKALTTWDGSAGNGFILPTHNK